MAGRLLLPPLAAERTIPRDADLSSKTSCVPVLEIRLLEWNGQFAVAEIVGDDSQNLPSVCHCLLGKPARLPRHAE